MFSFYRRLSMIRCCRNLCSRISLFDGIHLVRVVSFMCCLVCFVCVSLCLVCTMLSVSLDCPLLIALWFSLIFVPCLVYPMLSVSLDCPYLMFPSFLSRLLNIIHAYQIKQITIKQISNFNTKCLFCTGQGKKGFSH